MFNYKYFNMKKLSLLALALIMVIGVNAQKIGVKAGGNMSGYTLNFDSPDGSKMGMGLNAGLVGELGLTETMNLRVDLGYNQLGSDFYSEEDAGVLGTMITDIKSDVSYLNLGVSAKMNFGPAYAFVGPYFGYALSNVTNGSVLLDDVALVEIEDFDNFGDQVDGGMGDFVNKMDFGLNLGFGADFSGIFVEANIGYGFANYYNKNSDTYTAVTDGATLINDAGMNAVDAGFSFTDGTTAVAEPKQSNLFFGLSVGYMFGGE